jgi:lipooligosaccharide transport system permease protein
MAFTQPQSQPVPGGDEGSRAAHGLRPPLSATERVLAVFTYFLTVYRRTWRGSIIGRFLSPLFFLLAMGIGLGSLIDDRVGGVDGLPYLQFVVPAIVATQTMWVAMGESTYQVLGYIKWNMGYHAMLASPLSVRDVLRGHFLAVAAHLTTATVIFMGVAALFGGFGSVAAVSCLPIAVLTGMAFVTPIFAFTAKQEGDDGFNILFRWIVTPLMLFSGTFFPIEQLPGWMQPLAWVTPLWHGVEACRDVATGSVSWLPFVAHLLVLAGYAAVGWLLAERTFAARLVP